MKLTAVLYIICSLFWLAAAILGIVFQNHDWRISFIIASFALSAMMGIFSVAEIMRNRRDE